MKTHPILPKPAWLRQRLPANAGYETVRTLIKDRHLYTVCQEAQCPNRWECYSKQTATFLILGPGCTRDCRFCAVNARPQPPDPSEPTRVAETIAQLKLKYAVITSVTRDDLADGGAGYFAQTISAVRNKTQGILIEVLIPDFGGNTAALQTVIDARPDVINHNIETVSRLYPVVRPQANYRRSLHLLLAVKTYSSCIPTKSGMMLGLGETGDEILQSLQDLRDSSCDILTLGQYLQPTRAHLPVERYITPAEFSRLKSAALQMGFSTVASGPFVRSSYHAGELYGDCQVK
ncbi:MAG: lipoyl synthase [Desulfobacterales bacterium]|nr:lipoyl synthase [Desulfobacterales bacterium]